MKTTKLPKLAVTIEVNTSICSVLIQGQRLTDKKREDYNHLATIIECLATYRCMTHWLQCYMATRLDENVVRLGGEIMVNEVKG